jgi:hypothetical protein
MKSRWYELKNDAIKLRKRGISIRKVERHFGIPRSTLSGWFRNIKLEHKQKEKLLQDWKNALIKARKKAILWHNAQKVKRLKEAENQAVEVIKRMNVNDKKCLS